MPTEQGRCVVVDTNILLRAVFGLTVAPLIDKYVDSVAFCAPDICFLEARANIPGVSTRRGFDVAVDLSALSQLMQVVGRVDPALYGQQEGAARRRIAARDPNDWAILATALSLDCPIWTEDQDFFGCGVATWNSRNIEIYLKEVEGKLHES